VIGAGAEGQACRAGEHHVGQCAGGGVEVDATLETSAGGIYAAGDMAEYQSVVHDGRRMRIEHWDVAAEQGKTAAQNMLGAAKPHDVVPYFFSDLSDWASLEYVGPASDWDHEVVRGSFDDGEFSVWYLHRDRLAAALSVGRSGELEHARRLIASGAHLGGRAEALADPSSDLAGL
jgi:3-phenylpropionate/trans-cinnamate dioxygenase ferredoxin reductase subunit